ncbi:MAG: peptidylprolyl isomerase [Deltaproteobacteria bacterium]|nr:peptidylprolyl isomerase [Deltaproteobacteria bacterium]
MKKLSLVVLLVAALAGCPPPPPTKGEGPAPAADGGVAAATPKSQTRIGALPLSSPVLIVEGVTFTRADLERAIQQHAASMGMPPSDMVPEVRDTLEAPAYEKIVDRQLFSTEAKKRGLWPSDQKVAEEREKILRTLPPSLTIDGFFAKLGTDDVGFRKEIATDVALGALFEALQKEQKKPDPKIVRQFFDDNKDKFVKPEAASASHILVRLERGAPQEQVEKAQQRAAEIRKEVAGKDKATFARVALAKSEDPRVKDNKGDLGKFPRGVLVKELDQAVFALKDGELSEVIRTDFGLHIVRGQGISKAGLSTFDEVKAMIEEREGAKLFAASLDALVLGMRKSAKIDRLVEPAPSSVMPTGKAPPGAGALPVPLAPMAPQGSPPPAPTPPPAPPVVVPPGGATG